MTVITGHRPDGGEWVAVFTDVDGQEVDGPGPQAHRALVTEYDADGKWIMESVEEGPWTCKWFALCQNDATGTSPHPVLGDVPTCDRCAHFAEHGEFPKEES